MTEKRRYDISRRKLLAGLGTVGIASAGAGLGTTAYFTDTESFETNTLQAGELDLKLDYRATYAGGAGRLADVQEQYADATEIEDGVYLLGQAPPDREDWAGEVDGGEIDCNTDGLLNGDAIPVFDLADVKPGDEGEVTMSLHICDNPAYLRMNACISGDENSQSEPEIGADPTGSGAGELASLLQVNLWYDRDCSNTFDDGETLIYRGTLAGLGDYMCDGLLLDGQGRERIPREDGECTLLGKLEDLSGTRFQTVELEDGSGHAADGNVYTFDDGTDGEPRIELSNFQLEDDELVGFDFEVLTEGVGVCRVLVKADEATEEVTYGECVTSGTAFSPLSGRPNRVRQEVSHVTFSVCEEGESEERSKCFAPGGHCVGLSWTLPASVGNEVQTDTASFDLAFDAEQCRHNDDPFAA